MSKSEDEPRTQLGQALHRMMTLGPVLNAWIEEQPKKAQGELTVEAFAGIKAGEAPEAILSDMVLRLRIKKLEAKSEKKLLRAAKEIESGKWAPRRGKPREGIYKPKRLQGFWISAAVDWARQSGRSAKEAARRMRVEIKASARTKQRPASGHFKGCPVLKRVSTNILNRMTAEVKKLAP